MGRQDPKHLDIQLKGHEQGLCNSIRTVANMACQETCRPIFSFLGIQDTAAQMVCQPLTFIGVNPEWSASGWLCYGLGGMGTVLERRRPSPSPRGLSHAWRLSQTH